MPICGIGKENEVVTMDPNLGGFNEVGKIRAFQE
jgi:hypothetical protein